MRQIILIIVLSLLTSVLTECAVSEESINSAMDNEQQDVFSVTPSAQNQDESADDDKIPEEQKTQETDPNAPTRNILRYRLKKNASGGLMKDASGNFIFVPIYDDKVQEGPSEQRPGPGYDASAFVRPGFQRKTGGYDKPSASLTRLHRHSLEIGSEVYYFKYEEPDLMEDTGMFYGAVLGYTYRGWVPTSPDNTPSQSKGMIRFEGRCAFGRVDYDGQLMDGTPYEMDHIDDYLAEGRLLFGAEAWDGQRLATFYTGIGYRYLNDDTAFDPAGYERESNYVYLPLGCQVSGGLRDGWSWGGTAEFDLLLLGNQRSHLSDVGLFDVDNNQKKGVGCRGAIRIQHRHKNRLFVIEPFIRYWDIGKSEVSSLGYEPANETIETGIQLIWGF